MFELWFVGSVVGAFDIGCLFWLLVGLVLLRIVRFGA